MEVNVSPTGRFEARYLAFLETVAQLRPKLHRYCARMTGSVLDGEDVVQDALFEAYRKLEQFDDNRSLSPWIFRIAHNRCIDFLRSRGARNAAEANVTTPDSVPAAEPATLGIRPAIEHLVVALPPKERACVLLKDVFDYSLEEVAELVDSTIGGVKAALKRGRTKLTAAPAETKPSRTANPELTRLLNLYVERFNRQDWDGLRELISADAQLRVADAFEGPLADAPYFFNYARLSIPWKLSLCELDGEPVVVVLRRGADTWAPHSYVRLQIAGQLIDRIVDYSHCPWVASLAEPVAIADETRGQYVSRNARDSY
jgi:RNA polymerase sigma-70 factor, ECF subfamily